jgi:hypothetical protein
MRLAPLLRFFFNSLGGGMSTAAIIERHTLKPRALNCGAWSVLGRRENTYTVFQTRCGSWSCPRCCQLNTCQWARKVAQQPATRFLTLTNLGETRDDVVKRVREFHRRLRVVGIKYEYWGMVELHKSGLPHWHSLCFGDFIPPLALKWICRESGIGHSDVRQLTKKKGCVYYCTKHLGHAHGRRWSGRQVRYSRGFFVNKFEEEKVDWAADGWEFELVCGRADSIQETLKTCGMKTLDRVHDVDYRLDDTMVGDQIKYTRKRDWSEGYNALDSKLLGGKLRVS